MCFSHSVFFWKKMHCIADSICGENKVRNVNQQFLLWLASRLPQTAALYCIWYSMEKNMWDKIALVLLIIGGLNWGLIGIFSFDLVAWLFGGVGALLSRTVYILVALSAIWCISLLFRNDSLVEATGNWHSRHKGVARSAPLCALKCAEKSGLSMRIVAADIADTAFLCGF